MLSEFQNKHLTRLNQVHLNTIVSRQTQFVGTRNLALAIKFIETSLRYKGTREMIKPMIEQILFSISLPLFVTT